MESNKICENRNDSTNCIYFRNAENFDSIRAIVQKSTNKSKNKSKVHDSKQSAKKEANERLTTLIDRKKWKEKEKAKEKCKDDEKNKDNNKDKEKKKKKSKDRVVRGGLRFVVLQSVCDLLCALYWCPQCAKKVEIERFKI